ncbi:MAG: hypothetical protein QXT54_04835 [Thermoplasmatales archaeon]
MTAMKKIKDSISDKDPETLRKELMSKAKDVYCQLQSNFETMSRRTNRSHLRNMLLEFAQEAGRDCQELEQMLSKNSWPSIDIADRNLGMFSHLVLDDERSLSDEEKVIFQAIKVSNNLKNIFSIMSKEYRDEQIRRFFETLYKHEIHRENELEQLYDEIIVQGQW